MSIIGKSLAINAIEIPANKANSLYPEPFASLMKGRERRKLGNFFGLTNFGINLTTLAPNAMSALKHSHSKQDEFIYVLSGQPTLQTNDQRITLSPGMCAGFKAGNSQANHLINETESEVIYLEIGDRTPGDEVDYPDDDLLAKEANGHWIFFHKDGTLY